VEELVVLVALLEESLEALVVEELVVEELEVLVALLEESLEALVVEELVVLVAELVVWAHMVVLV
jgi:hypothetical protein